MLRSRRPIALALPLALLAMAPASAGAATSKSRAITLVTRILATHRSACQMQWTSLTAVRTGRAWRVTANVTTSGNPGTASWWVQRSSAKVTPADPLSAEIEADCP